MKLTTLAAAAAVGFPLAALPAGASTLEMLEVRIDEDNSLVYADQGLADNNAASGSLNVSVGPVSGYETVTVSAIKQEAPPFDQLLANVTVANTSGGPEAITIEVTGRFENNVEGLWPGQFSANANDVRGSTWDITSWIGSAAYDRQVLGLTANGSLFAVSNVIGFNPNDYWVTHVFNHEAGPNVSAQASVDFIAPVPVPAAGFLLIGAFGGLAALRRRPRV